MPEKHSIAMPPMTPPMIAPVLFADEPPVVLSLPPFVSFAGPTAIDGVIDTDALSTVDGDDDESAVVEICVVAGVVGEDILSETEPESAVGEIR